MALIQFKDLPDTSTPLNATNLNNNFNELKNVFLEMYPVGRVVMFYDTIDHSNFLDFRWERTMLHRFPVGYDTNDGEFNSIGKKGGERTHMLTVNEMPKHSHAAAIEGGSGSSYVANGFLVSKSPLYYIPTSEKGGNQPHNNTPEYEVVAFWKRVA